MKLISLKYLQKKIVKLLLPLIGVLILFLNNTKVALSQSFESSFKPDQKIIEYLHLSVPAKNKDSWLEAEKVSWEPWLKKQKGFLERQLFWDPEEEKAILMISWLNRKDWKAIPQNEINAVQEVFEKYARESTGINNGNPFPLLYEGELLPQ